jgi:hypothetical protein
MTELTDIREQVRRRYAAAATRSAHGEHHDARALELSSCDGAPVTTTDDQDRVVFGADLYTPDTAEGATKAAVASSLGPPKQPGRPYIRRLIPLGRHPRRAGNQARHPRRDHLRSQGDGSRRSLRRRPLRARRAVQRLPVHPDCGGHRGRKAGPGPLLGLGHRQRRPLRRSRPAGHHAPPQRPTVQPLRLSGHRLPPASRSGARRGLPTRASPR